MLSELLKSSITDKNSSSVWLLGAPRPARRVPHCLKPYAAWCQPHNCSDQRRWYHSAHPASVSRLQSISHVTARQKTLILPHKTLQLPSSSSLIYHQEEWGGLSGCIFWVSPIFHETEGEYSRHSCGKLSLCLLQPCTLTWRWHPM